MAHNAIRSGRLARPDGTIIMVPMDHGASMGPIAGLQDPATTLAALQGAGATCVTAHKGNIPIIAPHAGELGIMLHLSASTDYGPDSHDKRIVATVEEAVRLGCDGVSIHVNVGATTEPRQMQDAGKVSTSCHEWGMPLLAMMYPRGPGIDPFDPDRIAHAARLGQELGADIVKVPYTGESDTFRRATRGCHIPVVVSGGPRQDDFAAFLAQLKGAREAGARGVSIGRNVFQADDPAAALQKIAQVFP